MRQFSIISVDSSNTYFHCRAYERYHYQKNFKGYAHMHSYTEFFFVTKGKGFFHLKDKKMPIHRGMLVINNANVQHTESSHPDSELEYAVLCVDNLLVQSQQTDDIEQTYFLDFSADYDLLYGYINKIEQEWNTRELFWQYALNTHFNSFILHALRHSNLLGIPAPTTNFPNPLANVHLYLSAYYAEDISLDKLADTFSMNKYYLSHSYKKRYGETIMHSLNKIRCETARNLLQNTSYAIGQISIGVGYNSCSHFAKVYRNFYGETPTQTRQNFLPPKE